MRWQSHSELFRLTIRRSTKIEVLVRGPVEAIEPSKIINVLPTRRIQSCDTQVAIFRNRWLSNCETRLDNSTILVRTGHYVYDVGMIRAM